MDEGTTQGGLQTYLEKFTPLKCLPLGPTLSEEESIRWLIDEAFRASKLMIRTHLKEDIIRFIVLAQVLESHGYRMQWIKFKGCIGATKVKGDNPMTNIPPMPKEVQKHADKRSNGGLNGGDQPV